MPASRTALLVAAIRASHLRWNHPPIFTDDYALQMTTPFWRLVATNRLLNRLIVHRLLRVFRPIHTENILRIRYAEDRLQEAVAAGAAQYVILGAGLDTFSLRQGELAERLRIYEVDHPGSQAMKRERLIAINGSVPANLVLVPVDFETDRLDEKLTGAGFDTGTPAFFSWLGTTYYLTREAIRDTLEGISAVAAPGSRIVLDYKYPRRLIPEHSLLFADKVDRFVAKRGEPMRSMFAPEELSAELARAGFTELDSVPPEEQARRYLQGRTDMPPPAANFAFALFGLE
jgi:methyltransferase (TIGR00027 family)